MYELVKGAHVGLAALSDSVESVFLSLDWASQTGEGDADVSVLLLNTDREVRSDADFSFYNDPVAADGSVQLLGKAPTGSGNQDRTGFDLTAVPQDVDRVVVAASRYGGAHFGELDDPRLTLSDSSGDGLLTFAVEDAGSVSAFIFGELYRRAGEWKIRAVGQGYDSGLAGLATDFGVDIEDDAEAAAAADAAEAAERAEAVEAAEAGRGARGSPRRDPGRGGDGRAARHPGTAAPGAGGHAAEERRADTGFRLSLFKGMGSSRGSTETGFIRSVDDAVHRFYATVVTHLDRQAPQRTPRTETEPVAR
ncbi:TerD family protein [Streptomyces sp. JB150]|nr:TerD family protein [Streptomyces sp. JB150]